jgi:DNA-binding ferritin-like protein
MAYKTRESDSIAQAAKRLTGLKAIDPTAQLELGNGYSIPNYIEAIATVQKQVDAYNEGVKKLNGLKNATDAAEKKLDKYTSGMLTAVGQKYNKDSTEYEQAGGTRESARAHRVPKGSKKKSKPAE